MNVPPPRLPMGPCSVQTFGLTRHFDGFVAVDNLDLAVEKGSFFGFLGPNGAGKSTTIKMLTGLIAPSSGQARLLGLDVSRRPLEVKRRIGVVPEDLCLFDHLRAREYLHFVGRMHRLPEGAVLTRTEELLALLGMADTGKTLCVEFSHGMKKKLALAAALIHDPELLFLDEPFEGIDAVASRTIRHVLERVVQRGGTIFLSSHILTIVEKLCTHVGIIHRGRLVCQGSLASVTAGRTLEDVFLETLGEMQDGAPGLSWLGDRTG